MIISITFVNPKWLLGIYDKDKIDILQVIGMVKVYKLLDILWLNRMINHRVIKELYYRLIHERSEKNA